MSSNGENGDNGENEGGGTGVDFATARGRDYPSVRQFNVFVENRVGNLLSIVRRFEATDIRIVSLTVVDSADCAIIRLVLTEPDRAREIFELAKLPITESDLLVVEVPDTKQPIVAICKALLGAELGINYAYPLLIGPHGRSALAIHVEDHETAARTLARMGFTLFTEGDLDSDDDLH